MKDNTIFLVEEDVNYIKEFCKFFEDEYTIICSANGDRTMDTYAEHNTDIKLIILSNTMQKKYKYDILTEIRSFCDVPVMVIMENHESEPQISLYRRGADECISRDISFSLLKMKMEAILKRVYGTDNSIQEGILELDLDKKTLKVDEEYIDVTIKEFDLLLFFMRNKHAIQSRDQIITAVWGLNYEGSDRVVDSLVKKLRLKLKTAADYIHTAYGMGYYFELPMNTPA